MQKKYNLILQSFGRESEYRRAILTILSYYAYTSASINNTEVLLFTDQPKFFEPFVKGLPISYILLTPDKIKHMRGEIDFLHRMKIALIEEAFQNTNGILLYADSDTFFIGDPTPLADQVSANKAYMHLFEYPFVADVEDKTVTYRQFYQLINRQMFSLANGEQIEITPQHCSWNAGVMFFHPDHARHIPDVYALTEQFYKGSGSHASEQYAFSIILQNHNELASCDEVIYHYWYRVKKQITDDFLSKRLTNEWGSQTLEKKLAQIKEWCIMLPGYYNNHEWMIQDNAIQAFNDNRFSEGYRWTFKAILKKPLGNGPFLKDTIYHLKRHITKRP